VRVGEQDEANRQPVLVNGSQKLIHLVTRVDDDTLARFFAADDKTILEEGGNRAYLENHDG